MADEVNEVSSPWLQQPINVPLSAPPPEENYFIINVKESDQKAQQNKITPRTFTNYKALAKQIITFIDGELFSSQINLTEEDLEKEIDRNIAYRLFSFFKILSTKVCRPDKEGGTFYNKTDIYHTDKEKYLYSISWYDISKIQPSRITLLQLFCKEFNEKFAEIVLSREDDYREELKKLPTILDYDTIQELYLGLKNTFTAPLLENAKELLRSQGIKFKVDENPPELLLVNTETSQQSTTELRSKFYSPPPFEEYHEENLDLPQQQARIYDILDKTEEPLSGINFSEYQRIKSNIKIVVPQPKPKPEGKEPEPKERRTHEEIIDSVKAEQEKKTLKPNSRAAKFLGKRKGGYDSEE
jgi:hypothetical protein